MEIKSRIGHINKSDQDVFDFLNDLNNYRELFPDDKISDWKSDKDSCSFKIKGAASIGFIKKSTVPFSEINLISDDKSPIEFGLNIFLTPAEGKTEGRLEFESNVNPFLRMMIEKPLKNLFGLMIDNMEKKFN
jgi:carbon monoxide dehydrogenase subunit G